MAGAITGITSGIGGTGNIRPAEPIQPAGSSEGADFRSVLSGAIDRVEKLQTNAGQAVDRYLSGDNEDVHTAAMAVQRAEISLDMFLQTRNKVVSAYQEIMRMQM
jgi:flagellar hook-basal body complex protein FliE